MEENKKDFYLNQIYPILENIPKDFLEWNKLKKDISDKISDLKKKNIHCLFCDGLDPSKVQLNLTTKTIIKAYNDVVNNKRTKLMMPTYINLFCKKCISDFKIEERVIDSLNSKQKEYHQNSIEIEKKRLKSISYNVYTKGDKGFASPFQRFDFVGDYMENYPEKAKKITNLPYKEFLNHWYWWAIAQYVKYRNPTCSLCNSESNLNVHHKTYKNKGKEYITWREDLIVLCKECHSKFHDKIK